MYVLKKLKYMMIVEKHLLLFENNENNVFKNIKISCVLILQPNTISPACMACKKNTTKCMYVILTCLDFIMIAKLRLVF